MGRGVGVKVGWQDRNQGRRPKQDRDRETRRSVEQDIDRRKGEDDKGGRKKEGRVGGLGDKTEREIVC